MEGLRRASIGSDRKGPVYRMGRELLRGGAPAFPEA